MKFLIILIAMIGVIAGALHAYQKRNLLLQAALLSEGYTLSAAMKAGVSDYYSRNNKMPHDNQTAELPPAKSIYGTIVKRVSVMRSGLVMVDFDKEIGRQSMLFTPSVSPVTGLLEWRCSSDSIDQKVLELLRPTCSFTAATNEGKPMVLARLNPDFAGEPQLGAGTGRTEIEQSEHLEKLYPQLSQAAIDCHVQRLSTLFQEEGDYNPPEMVDGKPMSTQIQKPECSTKLRQYVKTKNIYKKALSARFSAVNKACDLKSVETLLRSNPGIDIVGRERLHSHFEQAMYAGCSALVAFYIRDHGLGDKIDGGHLLGAIRKTPQNKQVAIVGALLAAGVDVNYRDPKGDTPLAEAISLEQPVVSKYLVDAGADVSAPTRSNSYPLIEASKKGYHHLVLQLIQHGADVNQQDALGRTALVAAVARARRRLVDTLLRAGANASLKDNNGINAVMLSQSRNYKQIYSQLTASAAYGD